MLPSNFSMYFCVRTVISTDQVYSILVDFAIAITMHALATTLLTVLTLPGYTHLTLSWPSLAYTVSCYQGDIGTIPYPIICHLCSYCYVNMYDNSYNLNLAINWWV